MGARLRGERWSVRLHGADESVFLRYTRADVGDADLEEKVVAWWAVAWWM